MRILETLTPACIAMATSGKSGTLDGEKLFVWGGSVELLISVPQVCFTGPASPLGLVGPDLLHWPFCVSTDLTGPYSPYMWPDGNKTNTANRKKKKKKKQTSKMKQVPILLG